MEPEAVTSYLNFGKKSLRGVASRSIRVKSPSINGSSFSCGSQIRFRIPSSVKNTFLDGETMYLRLPVTCTNADAILEGSTGAYSFIKKIEINNDTQSFCNINDYAKLVSGFSDLEASNDAKNNRMKLMYGMSSDRAAGYNISYTAGPPVVEGSKVFCLPLVCTPLYNAEHYIPMFSRSSFEIIITMQDAYASVINSADDIINSEITFNAPELVYYQVEVNDKAMTEINEACGGVYSLNLKNYRQSLDSISAAADGSTYSHTLGFSMSSLESLFLMIHPSATAVGATCASQSNRTAGVSEWYLTLNGENIPARNLLCSESAETMAELAIRERTLSTFHYPSSINNDGTNNFFELTTGATGTSSTTIGSFLAVIDLESMHPKEGDDLYCGISTLGATLQSNFTTSYNPAAYVSYFAQNTINLTLNMNSSQTWVLSV